MQNKIDFKNSKILNLKKIKLEGICIIRKYYSKNGEQNQILKIV